MESTLIQSQIQDSVTNGRGYASANYAAGRKTEADLQNKLNAMDDHYPRTIYFEPNLKVLRADNPEPVSIQKTNSSRHFSGLVPIGFTAHRSLDDESTVFVNNDNGQIFYR